MGNIVKTSVSFLAGLGVGIGAIKAFKVIKKKLDNEDDFEPEFEEEDLEEDMEDDTYEDDDLDDEYYEYLVNKGLAEYNQLENDNDI